MEAQQIKTIVEKALISYSGTTTGDGGAGGDTMVCSALTAQPDYNRLSVLIAEGTYAGLTRDINGVTTGGTITVEPVFPGQIVSGINFHIIPRLPAYSELIDIMGAGFDTATDSLAKLKDDLVSLLASIALTQKLAIKGTVASIPAANQFIVTEFIGLGAGKFAGATLPWQVFVLRDAGGAGAAPQGQLQPVTAFDSATGQVNHSAFTVALVATDEILLLHPSVAHIDFSTTEKTSINTEVDNALDTAIPGSPTADSINELIKGLGDFEGLTNFSTLLALLGIPDTAAKPLYTVLVTDLLGHAAHGLVQLQVEIAAIAGACALEATLGTHDTDIKALLGTIAGYLDNEIAQILALVDSAESAGPFSYLDAGGEQTVKEDTAVTRRRIWLDFSNRNMTQTGTFRIYRKVDGTNYDLYVTVDATVAASADRAWDAEFTVNQAWKLTYEEGADEGAARAIPYNVITQVIE